MPLQGRTRSTCIVPQDKAGRERASMSCAWQSSVHRQHGRERHGGERRCLGHRRRHGGGRQLSASAGAWRADGARGGILAGAHHGPAAGGPGRGQRSFRPRRSFRRPGRVPLLRGGREVGVLGGMRRGRVDAAGRGPRPAGHVAPAVRPGEGRVPGPAVGVPAGPEPPARGRRHR